jgi:sterol desaturase/sphingolipid hydroxylase (fatty acid hydroxylase superfamily)
LEYIFLSPAQHQIHHGLSPKQHHKNMGVGLSIWDQIWGTFHTEKKYKKIEFGLNEKILNHKINLSSVIIDPLKVAINKTIIKRT